MHFYKYMADSNHYDSFHLSSSDSEHLVDAFFTRRRIGKRIRSVQVQGFDDNPGIAADFASFNDYSRIPLCTKRAWQVLEPLIGYCTEAIPVEHPSGGSFFLLHVMDVVDCLDESRSVVTRNSATKRVSKVRRYAFHERAMKDKHIFRLPLKSGSDVLVSDEFRRICDTHQLTGLLFETLPLVDQ